MTLEPIQIEQQLHVVDVRKIAETTSVTMLMGPVQNKPWTARLYAHATQEDTERRKEFSITDVSKTERTEYPEYKITIYFKPNQDFPSMKQSSEAIAKAWQTQGPERQEATKLAFMNTAESLDRYFTGVRERIVIDKPMNEMNQQEQLGVLDTITELSEEIDGQRHQT